MSALFKSAVTLSPTLEQVVQLATPLVDPRDLQTVEREGLEPCEGPSQINKLRITLKIRTPEPYLSRHELPPHRTHQSLTTRWA